MRTPLGAGGGTARRTIPRPGGSPRPLVRGVLVALALAAAGAPRAVEASRGAEPQPPQTPFVDKVDVTLVLVPVVVRDGEGRPITDLAQEEFSVLDEGVLQPIAAFGREARPLAFLLALDMSPSMQPHEGAVKRAALEFVRAQREDASFALTTFSDAVVLEQDFTRERKILEGAIGAVRTGGDNTALLDALAAASRHLEKIDAGRVAVVFTDGTETVHPLDEAEARLGAAVEDAFRRDVAIYTVAFGPRAARGLLRRVADETGGEAFAAEADRDLPAAFAAVGASVGSRYLLGYKPPAGAPKGFRRIEVTVARPGCRVVARRGYHVR